LLSRNFWITVSILLVTPTVFLRKLDSLKYTSAFSLVAVAYLLLVVVWFFLNPAPSMPPRPALGDLPLFRFDSSMLAHLPIYVFAFTCHQNVILY
jgi:amino acid permease